MLFSAPVFLFAFLPGLLFFYHFVWRSNVVLVVASILFYTWGDHHHVVLLLFSIAMNYGFGLLIDRLRGGKNAFNALMGAVVCNLAFLCFFKYLNFIVANINEIVISTGVTILPDPKVSLPLGISFFTFQAISYVVDVYRGEARVQRNILSLAMYISMFSQLIAGPIVRYAWIEKDIDNRTVNTRKFAMGAKRFIVGLAKKVIIADTLAYPVDLIFATPATELSMVTAWLGVTLFAFQIYYDFSGYTDMAIGLGKMFGFNFPENFNYPYIAKSLRDFWRRWHITLSSWFRDYLYIPLGGNRFSHARTYMNLLIVFILCGLWHGASWNYLAWGLFHGMFLALERTPFGHRLDSAHPVIHHAYVLLVLLVGWAIFRSESMSYALDFIAAMCGAQGITSVMWPVGYFMDSYLWTITLLAFLICMPINPLLQRLIKRYYRRSGAASVMVEGINILFLCSMMVYSLAVIATHTHKTFIYFRF